MSADDKREPLIALVDGIKTLMQAPVGAASSAIIAAAMHRMIDDLFKSGEITATERNVFVRMLYALRC